MVAAGLPVKSQGRYRILQQGQQTKKPKNNTNSNSTIIDHKIIKIGAINHSHHHYPCCFHSLCICTACHWPWNLWQQQTKMMTTMRIMSNNTTISIDFCPLLPWQSRGQWQSERSTTKLRGQLQSWKDYDKVERTATKLGAWQGMKKRTNGDKRSY